MVSLIGNSDAFTSWSSNIPETINAPTYDDSQATPYIAPTPPPVITNVNTGTTTTLDSEFIDQIVRRNQENIYDSTKAQQITLLTDENGLPYAKQLDIDLLKAKTRYVVSDNENETHFTQNLKVDELLIRANGGDYKNLWDEIVNHSAHIYAGVQRDDNQDVIITANTTNISNNSSDIAGLATALNSNFADITTNTALLATHTTSIDAILYDIDHNIIPDIGNIMGSIDGHTTNIAGNASAIADNMYNIGENATSIDANIVDITALQLLTSKMGYDNTTNPNDTWVGFNPDNIHLNTNTYIKSLFYKVDGSNWSNVSNTFEKAIDNEASITTLEAQITTLNNDNFSHKNKLEKITYTSATGWFDIHALNTHNHGNLYVGDVLWVKHNGSWVSLDPHINNLVDIKLAGFQYMTYNGNQTTILNAITQEVANSTQNLTPATPYLSLGWVSPWGYIQQERRLPANSVIFAGDIYKTRETTHQETKLIPYLDDTGRLNSAFIWAPEFDNAVFGVNNPEKVIPNSRGGGQSNYVAGFVPSAEDVPDAFRYEYFLNSQGVWSNGYTQQLLGITTSFQDQINTRIDEHNALKNGGSDALWNHIYGEFSNIANKLGDVANEVANIDTTTGKAQENDMVIFGGDAKITASPVAIGYINDKGRLDTARLFDQIFNDQVFGVEDPDTVSSRRKSNAYLSGLVPTAENVADRTTKYLRADGTWVGAPISPQPTFEKLIVSDTGSQETIGLFQSTDSDCSVRIEGRGEAYLELSNTSPNNGSTANAWGIGVNDSNRLEFNWKPKGTTLNPTQNTLTLTHDGKVGIKRLVPTAELDVAGTVKATTFIGDGSSLTGLPDISLYDTSVEVDQKIAYFRDNDVWNGLAGVHSAANNDADTKIATALTDYDTTAEVDAKISAIPAPVSDPKLADFDRNIYNAGANLFMWDLQRIGYIAMPDTHFHSQIFWKPTGHGLTNLNVMNDRVNTLLTDVNALPDFDAITTSNKFCITNTANGGTISYITPTTSNFNEGSNLYYTDDRVATKITSALQGGEINNIITNQLQAQDFIANSDIRLKDKIIKIDEEDSCSLAVLEPVKYHFKNDDTKRTRYGFIAQDVEEVLPELVHTSDNGIKGINYQDIIALLVKDNQDLRQKLNKLEESIKFLSIDKL